MFNPKAQDSTDGDILQEIIQMCEKHMGGGLKKPDESAMSPLEGRIDEEAAESPMDEKAEGDKPDLEGADLEELMAMYKNLKG